MPYFLQNGTMSLKDEIASILAKQAKRAEADAEAATNLASNLGALKSFFEAQVKPAFDEFAQALEANGREVKVRVGDSSATLEATFVGRNEFDFAVEGDPKGASTAVKPIQGLIDPSTGRSFRSVGYFRSGAQNYGAADLTKEEIVGHMLREYRRSVGGEFR